MLSYKYKILVTQILLIIITLTLWELGTKYNIINSFIFSSPSKICSTLYELFVTNSLFSHIFVTSLEILISFCLGSIISFLISIILYEWHFLAKVLDPFLTMLNSLPKVALGPIIIIWFGANTRSIIVMALSINIIISILTLYSGFSNTDELKIKLFKSFKASRFQILTKLVIPSNYKVILNTLKINISLTLIGVIMGEFLVSKRGIGYLILYGTQVFNLDLVITGILILILLSYLIYKIVTLIEKFVINKYN